jgi:hypothetical protein
MLTPLPAVSLQRIERGVKLVSDPLRQQVGYHAALLIVEQ